MAEPIPMEFPARDPRVELQTRLQNAPLAHAEALLSAYEVLQGLHDRGVFELLRGALGSGDKVIEIIVEAAKTPESIRGMRNFIILAKILGTLEPEVVESFAKSLPEAIALTQRHDTKAPSLWEVVKKFTNKNFLRGLLLVNTLLETLGRNLPGRKAGNGMKQ